MNLDPRPRSLGLLIAFPALLFACGVFGGATDTPTSIRSYVQAEVKDPERSKKMLATLDRFEQRIAKFDTSHREVSVRVNDSNRDYDSTREDLESLMASANRLRTAARDDLLSILLELRGLATEKEWGAIVEMEIAGHRERMAIATPIRETEDQR